MNKTRLSTVALVVLLVCSVLLNAFQWYRSHNARARGAIISIWPDGDRVFDDAVSFEAFKTTVSSGKFIGDILDKPKYRSIRKKFLSDWDPTVTKTEFSHKYADAGVIYWGRESRVLSELIDEIYGAITLERNHYKSLAKQEKVNF